MRGAAAGPRAGSPVTASSGTSVTSAPASAASASAASMSAAFPSMSPTTVLSWASATRRGGSPCSSPTRASVGGLERDNLGPFNDTPRGRLRERPPPRHGIDPGGQMGSLPPQRRQAGGPGGGPGGSDPAQHHPPRGRRGGREALGPPELPRRPTRAGHVRLRRVPVPDPQPRGRCRPARSAARSSGRTSRAGPRPVPEGEQPGAAPEAPQAAASATVEEGVKLDAAGHRDRERQAPALTFRWPDGAPLVGAPLRP